MGFAKAAAGTWGLASLIPWRGTPHITGEQALVCQALNTQSAENGGQDLANVTGFYQETGTPNEIFLR